jgi:hypothetical protein
VPDFTLQDALKEAYASAPSAEVILHTLEFRHPSFTTPIRVVRDQSDFTATLEADAPLNPSTAVSFLAFAFDFTLPEVAKSGTPEIEIRIDNISGELIPYLDAAANSGDLIEVTYRPYLASDTSGPQMDPPLTLTVRSITADVFGVRARAGFADLANRKFPGEIYDAERFPGLVQL